MVEARYSGDQFYLSVTDIFSALRIDHRISEDSTVVSGFFLDEARDYRIDPAAGRISLEGEQFEITASEYVLEQGKVFLAPNVYSEVFGMSFTPNFRRLSLSLDFSQQTPLEAAAQREAQRSFDVLPQRRPEFDLLRPRRFNYVDGMVMDYGLRTTYSRSELSSRLNLQGGAELFGGDVQGELSAQVEPDEVDFEITSGRWRLVTDSPFARQTRAGWIRSSGLRSFSLRGVSLTNEPVRASEMYGSYRVEGETEPGWEVELYVNGNLLDVKEVDGQGQYHFDVPLSYGTTRIVLREYGPAGQVNVEERRVDVPFSFVPKGNLYYSVEAGQARTPPVQIVQSEASIGVANWLTLGGGYEYPFSLPARIDAGSHYPFGEFAVRLARGYILSGTIAPGVRRRFSFNGVFPSATSFEFTYERAFPNALYNRSGVPYQVTSRMSFPLSFLSEGATIRLNSRHTYDEGRGYSHRASPSLSASLFDRIRFNASYEARLQQERIRNLDFSRERQAIDLNLSYNVPAISGLFSPIGGSRLSVESNYDIVERGIEDVSLDLSRRIGNVGRASFQVTHRVPSGMTSGRFQLSLDLPNFRTSTSSTVRRGDYRISQAVSGAVAVDTETGDLNFSKRSWVGQSSATLRLFVDVNGNDSLDTGEEIIEDGELRFRRATSTRTTEEGYIRAVGLQAYERYNVTVDRTSIPNPLWIPQKEEFSFETDPNSFTTVDIPFYVAGVIEGSAMKQTVSGLQPIPGLDVIVDEVDGDFRKKIDVFNEGRFYDYQIPPGNHALYVDSTQLRKLGLRADPPVHEFTVEHTEQGDQVSGLKFVLKPREPEAPAIAEETEPEAEERPPEEAPQQPEQEQPAVAEERAPEPAPEEEAPEEAPAEEEAVAEEAAPEEAPEEAAAPAVGQDYFAIQLGAFSTYQTAQNYIEHSKILFDHPVTIRFKPEQELFAVEVDSFATRTAAAKLLETYQTRPYLENAFITEKSGPDPSAAYTIQIAAFSNQENADQHASKMQTVFERPVSVRYKEDRNVYAVEMDSYGSESEAREALTNIRSRDGLASAFVVGPRPEAATPQFRYALQLGAYRNQQHAQRRAEIIRQRLRREEVDVRIVASADGELHRVLLNPSTERERLVQLKRRLAERYGFTESFVTDFQGESEGSTVQ